MFWNIISYDCNRNVECDQFPIFMRFFFAFLIKCSSQYVELSCFSVVYLHLFIGGIKVDFWGVCVIL